MGKLRKANDWKFVTAGVDGIKAIVFGVNIFDYNWENTHGFANVADPKYGQKYQFPIYSVVINEIPEVFAAGNLSNGIIGFWIPSKRKTGGENSGKHRAFL